MFVPQKDGGRVEMVWIVVLFCFLEAGVAGPTGEKAWPVCFPSCIITTGSVKEQEVFI